MNYYDQRDDNRQGGGCSSRLLMMLAIALIGLFMYYNSSQENPITGQKQYVSISPAEEIRLGIQAAPKMASEMGGELPSTDPQTIEVKKIGNELLENSQAKKGPWKFQFHVVNDPKTINAFALPGGQIFITLGLLNKLQTEAQLAGVLAHEMGHVIQRHSAQQMAKSQLGQMLVTATNVGASDSSYQSAAVIAASVVNQMLQLRYSRHDELEADQWGLIIMAEAGYDPRAMLEVMRILKEASGSGRGPEMLMTHPYPDSRIEQIQEYLKTHPQKDHLKEGDSLKTTIQDRYQSYFDY